MDSNQSTARTGSTQSHSINQSSQNSNASSLFSHNPGRTIYSQSDSSYASKSSFTQQLGEFFEPNYRIYASTSAVRARRISSIEKRDRIWVGGLLEENESDDGEKTRVPCFISAELRQFSIDWIWNFTPGEETGISINPAARYTACQLFSYFFADAHHSIRMGAHSPEEVTIPTHNVKLASLSIAVKSEFDFLAPLLAFDVRVWASLFNSATPRSIVAAEIMLLASPSTNYQISSSPFDWLNELVNVPYFSLLKLENPKIWNGMMEGFEYLVRLATSSQNFLLFQSQVLTAAALNLSIRILPNHLFNYSHSPTISPSPHPYSVLESIPVKFKSASSSQSSTSSNRISQSANRYSPPLDGSSFNAKYLDSAPTSPTFPSISQTKSSTSASSTSYSQRIAADERIELEKVVAVTLEEVLKISRISLDSCIEFLLGLEALLEEEQDETE